MYVYYIRYVSLNRILLRRAVLADFLLLCVFEWRFFFLVSSPTSNSLSLITKTLSLMTTSTTAMMRFSIMGYDVDGVVGPYWEMAREFFSFSRMGGGGGRGYKKIKVPFFHLHSSAKGKGEIRSRNTPTEDGKRTRRTFFFFLSFFCVLWYRMCRVGISTIFPRTLATASFETELRAKKGES